jgi:bla regulator protein blaR1
MRALLLVCAVAAAVAILGAPRPRAQSFAAPAGTVPAPDPNVPLSFEAASVKPSAAKNPGIGIRRQPGGRLDTFNTPVKLLITFAYQVQDYQLSGGPGWISSDRFDIVAKFPGDPPAIVPGSGADHMMLAMRTLLADRFKLVVHKETRQLDTYALSLVRPGQPGPALKPASGDCSPAAFAARRGGPPPAPGTPFPVCGMQQGPGRIRFGGFPLSLFATGISNRLGRATVDHTGLAGNWDFELTFAAEVPPAGALPPGVDPPAVDPNAPDLFTAVREQLGIKIDSTKGPVEVLVIDSVSQPTPD